MRIFHIINTNKAYQVSLALLMCTLGLLYSIGITNYLFKLFGIILFSIAMLVSIYRFAWVKYFFYLWATVILLRGVYLFLPKSAKYTADLLMLNANIYTICLHLLYAIPFYAIGRLIDRFQVTKLNYTQTDLYVIATFISVTCYFISASLIYYFTDVLHIIPSMDELFSHVENIDESNPFAFWLLLWPIYLSELITSTFITFLLTLPFYRLWRYKQVIAATLFIPLLFLIATSICFVFYSIQQTWSTSEFLDGWDAVIPNLISLVIGIGLGGLASLFLFNIVRHKNDRNSD